MFQAAPPPQLPLTIRRQGAGPLQSQIADQIRRLVSEGILGPTSRVPSTRALSEQLGVSRNTVSLAYDLLIAEGLLEVESSAGTIVSPRLPAAFVRAATSPRDREGQGAPVTPRRALAFTGRGPRLYDARAGELPCDFRLGQPDPALFPHAAWRKLIVDHIGRAGTALVRYGDPGGLRTLRVAIAAHLRLARGICCEPEQVVVVAGCQEGLNLVARVLVTPGATAVVENPCYEGAALVLASSGARLVARRRRGALRRDDYDSDFRYEGSPLVALSALDRANTSIYLGTFSKSICAGLRVGFAVFPPQLVDAAIAAKGLLNNGHPWLEQAAAAEFLESGGFERHLQRIRRSYLMRRDCLLFELQRHFGASRVDGAEGGMHVAWHLPSGAMPASELQRRLAKDGVGIYSLDAAPVHMVEPLEGKDTVVLLGYPCLTEDRIRTAVERIKRALDPPGGT